MSINLQNYIKHKICFGLEVTNQVLTEALTNASRKFDSKFNFLKAVDKLGSPDCSTGSVLFVAIGYFSSEQQEAKLDETNLTDSSAASQIPVLLHTFGELPATMLPLLKIYFIKCASGQLQPVENEVDITYNGQIEFGVMTGENVADIAEIVRYACLATASTSIECQQLFKDMSVVAVEEIRSNVTKFSQQVHHSCMQVKGESKLTIPIEDLSGDQSELAKDYTLLRSLESALEDWTVNIAAAVEGENNRSTDFVLKPSDELQFWRLRNAALSTLYEQLQLPKIRQCLDILRSTKCPLMTTFTFHFSELSRLFLEAKDNAKFLTTLERHFDNIEQGSLEVVADTIPSLLSGLRMVWITSRHYNTDERMSSVLEKISMVFVNRISSLLSLSRLLDLDIQESYGLIEDGIEVLERWCDSYFKVRKRIEESGTDHRWEFDRKMLFSKTDYMIEVCKQLKEIISSIEKIRRYIRPDIISMLGENQHVDLIRSGLDEIVSKLRLAATNSIFHRSFEQDWIGLVKEFQSMIAGMDSMSESLIEGSFSQVKSAENAVELAQKLKTLGGSFMDSSSIDRNRGILARFQQELLTYKNMFKTQMSSPPIIPGYPPIAGAIFWASDLHRRAKKPILRMKKRGIIGDDEFSSGVRDEYLQFSRDIDDYCNNLHTEWEQHAQQTVIDHLKLPILKSIGEVASFRVIQVPDKPIEPKSAIKANSKVKKSPSAASASQIGSQSQISTSRIDISRDGITNSIAATQPSKPGYSLAISVLEDFPKAPYQSNFSQELSDIICESKILDKLGYRIPESALDMVLQEAKFRDLSKAIDVQLNEWNAVMDSLADVERIILDCHVADVEKIFQKGFFPLNWNSQRIPDFIDDMESGIKKFSSLVNQLHKNRDMIMEVARSVEQTSLVQIIDIIKPDGTYQLMEPSELFEIIESKRTARLEKLVASYHSISESFLLKIEEIVVGTVTGSALILSPYYHHWEKVFYNAIVIMVLRSIATMMAILESGQPICKVDVSMNGKDFVMAPPLNDVYKYLSRSVKGIAESAQKFVRWMHGTCVRSAPVVLGDNDDPYIFSFYQDLSRNSQVVRLILKVNQIIQRVFSVTNKYIDGWKRYDTKYDLWNPKRQQQMEKLVARSPSCQYLESAMSSYQQIVDSVQSQPKTKEVEFLKTNCELVASSIIDQANVWKLDYGQSLLVNSRQVKENLAIEMDDLERQVWVEVPDIDTLKGVLTAIYNIKEVSIDMELKISDVSERYRTLTRFNVQVPEDELASALSLNLRWHKVYSSAWTRDIRLIPVKTEYKAVTKQQDQDFREMLKVVRREFLDNGPGNAFLSPDDAASLLMMYQGKLLDIMAQKANIVNSLKLFGIDVLPYPDLGSLNSDLEKLNKIVSLFIEFREFKTSVAAMMWSEIDIASLQKSAEDQVKRARRMPDELKSMSVFKNIEAVLTNFKESLPLIVNLKNDAMKSRHWQKLIDATGIRLELSSLKSLTLDNVFSMELHRHMAVIEDIVNEAIQEQKIEIELTKIEVAWRDRLLNLVKYKKNGEERGFVIRADEELKMELEDHLLNLQAIGSSKFVLIYADRVRSWEKLLNLVADCLEMWYMVQKKWMYLESIFIGAEDIRLQLPDEAKRFDDIDKTFKAVMQSACKSPSVIQSCTTENRLDTLTTLSARLDRSQKSLSDYLETKRAAFPRFFFISDDELLSVLGSSDATMIQPHMLKLFDNTKSAYFVKSCKEVSGLESSEGESLSFKNNSDVDGPVEVWMTEVENEMRRSLQRITKEGVFCYAGSDRVDWIKSVLGMVSLVGSQIWWTWEVEDAFRRISSGDKNATKTLERKLTNQLNLLVVLVRNKLDKNLRKKLNALLIIDVHSRDIVDGFVRESVICAKEFPWESQLRFYWDRDSDDIVIRQCTGQFQYGYEFMGLNGRLVITPLTDRCYMTLTQALTFKLGGSPAGPAGTGKTETVKDLAKSMALPCFVINCGDGLDYKAMGSIYSGLIRVGAWGCFDEFNRINIEVLSVISAQLRAIQNALITGRPTVDIGVGAGNIPIRRIAGFATCGIFVTMNPGYAGRTELPDNLKSLFRPVTMVVPDMLQICEIMLFSEGFAEARELAKKMTVLYKLSREQLSKQYHYDFGLRALKSVLVMAGDLKRQYNEMDENLVLMRALRDSNMPKFVFEDVPLFRGLVNDLFPGMDCPRVGHEDLRTAAMSDLSKNGYHCSDEDTFVSIVDKIVQMHEIQLVRHTSMIVGPTGGGKSLILDTLRNARLAAHGCIVKSYVLNPKAQTINELYGTMDQLTRDWTDGILSKLFRDVNEPLPPGKENEVRWLVYDGDVDAVWVENMNSVMDDNKLLTLPNGERIRLQPYCSMICETADLQYASPATISRCGMVWVDPKNLGYRPYFERWLSKYMETVDMPMPIESQSMQESKSVDLEKASKNQRSAFSAKIMAVFDRFVPKSIELILTGTSSGEVGEKLIQVIPITNLGMVKQLCSVLSAFMVISLENEDILEAVFIFSILWSLGASLVTSSREKLDLFLRKLACIPLPNDGALFDYFYIPDTGRWAAWKTILPEYKEPTPFYYHQIIVPTTDSVRYSFFLQKLASFRPILYVGESGTAKTTTIQSHLGKLDVSRFSTLSNNFSSRTTSMDIQRSIEASVDKRSGNIYGPIAGKKLVVFIDDLNMPKIDMYGTQQPIALLHFLVSRGCFYDRGKDLNIKIIKDMNYIGAMGPPGGGRNNVDPRFVSLFSVFNLASPSQAVLNYIFSTILSFRFRNFATSVKEVVNEVAGSLLQIFNFLVDKLPPTPNKFHYVFNLRDLSRTIEGICQATEDCVSDHSSIGRLCRNEFRRVFCDRLVNEEDHSLVDRFIDCQIKDVILKGKNNEAAMKSPVLFGHFQNSVERIVSDGEDPRLYSDIGGYQDVKKIFDAILDNYNMSKRPMSLVLFEQALDHLCRIMRVISMPRGNVLLVGVGGSGKQSVARLAAYCAGYELFEITLFRNYGEADFKNDLKTLYKKLVTRPVAFLFTDADVIEEGFLEFINNMLTIGMVPALFEQDEKDQLISSVRNEVRELEVGETNEACWSYLVSKCRNNLHIILSMSPSGEKLRVRCRNFPGITSNTVIDWFFPWSQDALHRVAEFFLQEELLPESYRENITNHFVYAHTVVSGTASKFLEEQRRHYYVTPKNYLDFINNYRNSVRDNEKKLRMSIARLEGGLARLIEASEAVERMKKDLVAKKIVLDEKTKNVESLIFEIGHKTEVANQQRKEAGEKEVIATQQAIDIAREKEIADAALMEALPAVEAAAAALDQLNRDDLVELRAFASPPELVRAVCCMLVVLRPSGEKLEETWADAKKLLGNAQLLNLLRTYPKDSITDKQIKRINKYFKDNEDLNLSNMKSVSRAGHGILVWITAIIRYYEVASNVAPLRERVRQMEKSQQQTEEELACLRETLAALEIEIANLNARFKSANAELEELQHQAIVMEKRLTAASKLIQGLTGERTRWSQDIEVLKHRKTKIYGDCIVGASFLSYCGAFTNQYRRELLYNNFVPDVIKREIPLSTPFKLESLLTTEATTQSWNANGLPADEHSIQNGILTCKSSRFPLCIDPQKQAVTWIKNMYASQKLVVKTLLDSDFMKHLELSIQFGNPFLIENVDEELDPMLDPILEKNVLQEGGKKSIKLGDKIIDWDDNFKLFMTTKLANPHYSPEVMGKTMIINYGVTMDGLANQLLNVVVRHERPDLEEEYCSLVRQIGESALLMEKLEDLLLKELSSSQGNILDNEDLIKTLEETKEKSVETSDALTQASYTKDEISIARSVYCNVANRGSILYFAVSGLSAIMSIYETSLDSFLGVFISALDVAKRDVVIDNRLRNMTESVTEIIYDYACTGIFERHKLMFSFQLVCMIMDGEKKLNRSELDFFLKGDTSLDATARHCPNSWMPASGWKDLLKLSDMGIECLKNADCLLRDHAAEWKEWYDMETPETVSMPCHLSSQLSPMQQLCLLRCFRLDRVYNAIKLFVVRSMSEKYVQPPVLDYHRILKQSSPSMPVLFILSPGADPQNDIQKLCDDMGMTSKFKFVALGQGQGPIAEQILEMSQRRGYWVLLQNCHLLISWLKRLEKSLDQMKEPHKDFRLWMTTDPSDKFPMGILQRSLKVVTEPPDGLKLNMRSTYAKITPSALEECPHQAYRSCMYVLSFLHAVVLERRKYGKLGWNVCYDFNESDFIISRKLLSLYLTKAFDEGDEVLPWGSLKYLIGDAMYGGRVSDDMDRRVLSTYLDEYMGDFLFDDCQKFFFSRSGYDYCLPPCGELETYTKAVDALPLINSPAVLGLHPNAEIGYYTNATKCLWHDLISLQPRVTAGGSAVSTDETLSRTAKDIEAKIPIQSFDIGTFDISVIKQQITLTSDGLITPCQVVLFQEMERWNILVKKMALSLHDLQRALVGEIGMSEELDSLGMSLSNGFLPASWRRLAPDTLKPLGSWVSHFSRRHRQYEKWIEQGEPVVMWLAGLHIPESYLTALVQTTCRAKRWPLDKSTLYTVSTSTMDSDSLQQAPSEGCYVTGLFIEGADWDIKNGCLRYQVPKILVNEMPVLHVVPIESSKLKLQNTFKTPVYVTQHRRNAMGVGLVFEADLPTSEHLSLWVLQGVALVLNTDE